VETEDVVNVLRNVHRSVKPRGLVLDVHPVAVDFAVRAGGRGLGFVDTSRFAPVIEAMDAGVAQVVDEGMFEEVRTLRRNVVEHYDDAAEALEEADGWDHLRLPAAVRRRLERTDARPVELVDEVSYRLMRRRGRA
jgi:hypothetical protein